MKSRLERKSTTILTADIVGYSRLVSDDEEATLSHFRTVLRRFVRPTIVRHNGRLVKFIGDAVIVDFNSPADALYCAVQIQSDMTVHNTTIPEGRKMFFRIGIHWGEVAIEGEDLLGDTVNIASRLEGLAEPGGIVVSDLVNTAIEPSRGVSFQSLGLQSLKNIPDSINTYKVKFDPAVHATTDNDVVLQPYRGLAAFREADKDMFFGREKFVDLLLTAIQEHSLVAVVGSSGSGKSSVVAAGLLPQVRHNGWLIAQFRPGSHPFIELANSLQPLLLPDVSQSARRSAAQSLADTLNRGEVRLSDLSRKLRRQYPEATGLLIVADQFEEFLTLCTDPLQRELFQDLLINGQHPTQDAVDSHNEELPLVVVTTLRADFMGRLLEYRPLADAMQNGDIKLGPMTREELQRTVENPAKKQGVGFAPGLIERILDDVGHEPGNLPLLQFALTALWERDAELGAELSHQAYEEIGRVQGALAYHADDVFNTLQAPEQKLAQEVFVQLVQPGEVVASTRRIATRVELGEEGWRLIQRLADSRLVITSRNTHGEETAEVVHEALIRDWDRLRSWLSEDHSFRVWQERLRGAITQWRASEHDRGGLLRGVALSEAMGWRQSHGPRLNKTELRYIQLGQELLEEQQLNEKEQLQSKLDLISSKKNERKLKTLTVALASVLTIAIGAAVYASAQQRSAVEASEIAQAEREIAQEARKKAADALELAEAARNDAENARQGIELAKLEVVVLNRQILAQQLAAESALANDSPADRAAGLPILLGMEAVNATLKSDGYSLLVANDALREAVRTAPAQPWRTLKGHQGKVEALQFSADGNYVVTGGNDKLVNLWDIESGKLLHSLAGHQQRVTQARFVDNDQLIVSTSMDGTIRLWNAKSGKPIQTLSNTGGAVYDVAVNHDGTLWSTIGYDGNANILDAQTRETIHSLQGQNEPLYTVTFSPDSSRIATAGDTTAALWDVSSGNLIELLDTNVTAIRALQFSQDSQKLLIRGEDNHIDIRNAKSGERLYELKGHDENAMWSAVFSPDDESLLTAGGDGTVRLWNADTGSPIKTLIGHNVAVSTARFNNTGDLIASAGSDGAAILWDAATSRRIARMEGHQSAVSSLTFHPTDDLLATAGEDGSTAIWRLDELNQTAESDGHRLAGHGGGGQAIAFNPERNHAVTAAYEGSMKLWNIEDGKNIGSFPVEPKGIYSIDISPDGKLLASVGGSTELSLWDLDTLEIVSSETTATAAMLWTKFNHSGSQLITTSIDGTATLHNLSEGGSNISLTGHEGALFWAAFSPDDKLAATASYADNTVRIWDTSTGNTIHVLRGHSGGIYRCGFSPDGKKIVTASNDTTAKVWDLETGHVDFELIGHTSTVRAASFSPDNNIIVTASYDNTAKVWDANNGSLLHTLTGHQANLMTIAFSPDSSWFLTTSYDTTARIWDSSTGETLHTLTGHSDKLEMAAISNDGSLVITQGHDDQPRLWRTSVSDLLTIAAGKLPRRLPYFSTEELRRFRLGDRLSKRESAEEILDELDELNLKTDTDRLLSVLDRATVIDHTALQSDHYQQQLIAMVEHLNQKLATSAADGNSASQRGRTQEQLKQVKEYLPEN